jgi:phosphoribosyl-ATP pyrophosphohydrolase
MSRFTVHDLAATIDARAASGGEASYTRKLLDKGAEHCAKKLGEEAVETVIAAIENDRDHLIAESADVRTGRESGAQARLTRMIRKSGNRFSDRIMRKEREY